MEKQQNCPVAEHLRRVGFAGALALALISVQDAALPWRGYESLYVTGFAAFAFGISIFARSCLLSRLGLAVSIGTMTMNLLYVFGHAGGGTLKGIGISEGATTAILVAFAAFLLPALAPSSKESGKNS